MGCWTFRAKALARGISGATYDRVMTGLKPDMGVFALQRSQPEFKEQLWQYLNRRVSEWRIVTGRERAKQYAPLFDKLEGDFGVSRVTLLGLWGMETAYGDPTVFQNHMRPVFPCLAALAWGEPRRRAYWETELLNALRIVERGWGKPAEMRGSWAGAMGHTQWMPEVWLNIGADYDGDGRANPFGRPDDALAGTCRYLIQRGNYRRGEPWGYEVKGPTASGARSFAEWQKAEIVACRRQALHRTECSRARLGAGCGRTEIPDRRQFRCGEELQSVDELRARDLPSRGLRDGRRSVRAALPQQRTRADAG